MILLYRLSLSSVLLLDGAAPQPAESETVHSMAEESLGIVMSVL